MTYINDPQIPRVMFTPHAKTLLELYIKGTPAEVSGLGTVTLNGNDFLIEQIFLFRQVCSPISTEIFPNSIADLLYKRVQNNEPVGIIRLWWHSHYRSGVHWSPTDEATINEMFPNSDWIISIVGNCKGNYLARLDIFKPIRLTIDGLPLGIKLAVDEDLANKVADEILQKVKYHPVYLRQLLATESQL